MCGIVGYVGSKNAVDFLLQGLRRLEYRGYDSAGIVTHADDGQLRLVKSAGRIDTLAQKIDGDELNGTLGIGHTRWATHGVPNEANAHPHFGGSSRVAIAHNGVIENYLEIKHELVEAGYEFASDTDSEVIAQLIDFHLTKADASAANGDPYAIPVAAMEAALSQLRGTYGLVAVFQDYDGVIIAARLGSPLVVGIGDAEHFIASDGSPLAGYTDRIVYLSDNQMAVVTADSLHVRHRDQGKVQPNIQHLAIEHQDLSLAGYPHYMLKEIFEQPNSIRDTMRGRLCEDNATAVFGGLNLSAQQLRQVNRILLTACGTSWHAGLVGEYLIEELSRMPVEVEYGSELRYRNPPIDHKTILFAITQSGETADTLAALREIKRKGHPTLAICKRGRKHHCPRSGWWYLPARRAGDWCRLDKSLHVAADGADNDGVVLWATATFGL